jgi:hypothetical protein
MGERCREPLKRDVTDVEAEAGRRRAINCKGLNGDCSSRHGYEEVDVKGTETKTGEWR